VAILLIVGIGVFAYTHYSKKKPIPTTADGQTVNLEPATPTERSETDTHKENIANDSKQNTSGEPSTSASLVITSASMSGVRAYINGVFEENGVCTATATQGQTTYLKTSSGFQNVSYTQCAPIDWNTPLTTGTWQINVSYKSPTAAASQSKVIEVK
jgi:hypothetical protein